MREAVKDNSQLNPDFREELRFHDFLPELLTYKDIIPEAKISMEEKAYFLYNISPDIENSL
ncbi:MAG: hypothetical protein KAH04_06475 [Psychrilyobacter sp.]|nr:hypothetical protein [Psychrilyobacter sp.]